MEQHPFELKSVILGGGVSSIQTLHIFKHLACLAKIWAALLPLTSHTLNFLKSTKIPSTTFLIELPVDPLISHTMSMKSLGGLDHTIHPQPFCSSTRRAPTFPLAHTFHPCPLQVFSDGDCAFLGSWDCRWRLSVGMGFLEVERERSRGSDKTFC